MKTCPCNKTQLYNNCCKIAHNNIYEITTAEQLMRSRYSAFVMGNGAYLQQSQHSSTRPSPREAREIEYWAKSVAWIKLEVLETSDGQENDTTGNVAFKAFYVENSRVEVIHEHSRFCKENGHWVYLGLV